MKSFTLLLAAMLLAHSVAFAQESPAKANYPRAAEPAFAFAFMPLPLGMVEPQGWLRDWAVVAKNGITGHLDERHPVYKDAWKGVPIKWTGANPDGTGWPIEQCGQWMDGAVRLALILHDEPLLRKMRARLDPVVDGVNEAEFGISFIYWKKNWKPHAFDGWAHAQMGRALVSLYSGTRDKRVLDALVKVYADYHTESMEQLEAVGGYDVNGLDNVDPMMETYFLSGDRRILDNAKAAIANSAAVVKNWAAGELKPTTRQSSTKKTGPRQ
jgi:hypothetical protein